jgi:putative transposase
MPGSVVRRRVSAGSNSRKSGLPPCRRVRTGFDGEDLGAISLHVNGERKTVVGPKVMRGVSVAVWDAALADLRRQNQDLQKLIKPVVHRAIEFAQKGDAESRKRLSILYRPKSREQLEAIRMRMNQTVRHAEETLKPQGAPIDVLARRIAVGTKAPPPASVRELPPASRPEMPAAEETATKPARKPKSRNRSEKPQPQPPTKPRRKWDIKRS